MCLCGKQILLLKNIFQAKMFVEDAHFKKKIGVQIMNTPNETRKKCFSENSKHASLIRRIDGSVRAISVRKPRTRHHILINQTYFHTAWSLVFKIQGGDQCLLQKLHQ